MNTDNELISEAYVKILNEGYTPFNSERFVGALEAVVPLLKDLNKVNLGLSIVRGILGKFMMSEHKAKSKAVELANEHLAEIPEENLKKVIELITKREERELPSWGGDNRTSETEYKYDSDVLKNRPHPSEEQSSYKPPYKQPHVDPRFGRLRDY